MSRVDVWVPRHGEAIGVGMIRGILEAITEQEASIEDYEASLRSRGWKPGKFARSAGSIYISDGDNHPAIRRSWTGPVDRLVINLIEAGMLDESGHWVPIEDRTMSGVTIVLQDADQSFLKSAFDEPQYKSRTTGSGYYPESIRSIPKMWRGLKWMQKKLGL